MALRVAARQAGQPTDDVHLGAIEALLAARHVLDTLRGDSRSAARSESDE